MTARTTNHTSITGPKSLPTVPVPRFWMANSAIRMTIASGITQALSAGAATSRPSVADSTEIAGVMAPSPYSSAMPNRPISISTAKKPVGFRRSPITSVVSASTPPSPWLSARSTKITYLTATSSTIAHSIREQAPMTFGRSTGTW
jgi:hypothetical protein